MVPYYYVVRTYNGPTARKTLWKVLSRRMKSELVADGFLNFERGLYKSRKPHEFFVVMKMEEADAEYWKWFDLTQ
jgi:hypothetical protein